MIDRAVSFVVDELNEYFNVRSESPDRAAAGSLFDLDGNVESTLKNKVVVSLVNVERDRTYRSVETFEKRVDGVGERVQPPVKVNLYLLFIGNFSDYAEAMKAVSQVVGFFQHRPSVAYASVPALSELEGRMTFELCSLTFEQINHLWGALGGKYVPSVLYKVGIVDLRDRQLEAEVAPVTEIVTSMEGAGA